MMTFISALLAARPGLAPLGFSCTMHHQSDTFNGDGKMSDEFVSHVGEAIKVAENDPTRFGVRSEKVKSREEAQRVLDNSVRNNRLRWEKAGRPGKFIDFMQKRWAPLKAENDPKGLNRNWAGNVRAALKKRLTKDEYADWERQNLVSLSPVAEAMRKV